MKRSELTPGEVYAAQAGKIVAPILLVSRTIITLSRCDAEHYELSRARAAQGRQGGGLLCEGGSVTGVLGIVLPMILPWSKNVEVSEWMLTGVRPSGVADRPAVGIPIAIEAAYHLARDWAVLAQKVVYTDSGPSRISIPLARSLRHYTDADGPSSVQVHVFASRALRGTWASYVDERNRADQQARQHEWAQIADMTAIRERLEGAGFRGSVFFTGDDSDVIMSRADFAKLLDLI